jgi:aerobic carbon-monoxide dehydrogenase small subunit
MRQINLLLNGTATSLDVEDHDLLLDVLRSIGLTGAKPSCEMEVCGTCTVLLDGAPISSCTTLALEADGRELETIEGLARNGLHPVQEAFLEQSAFQCGYCTPGMILTIKALLETNPDPSENEIVHWMDGNLCRCTGYQPIVKAVQTAAKKMRAQR